jgi:hypothetical protein
MNSHLLRLAVRRQSLSYQVGSIGVALKIGDYSAGRFQGASWAEDQGQAHAILVTVATFPSADEEC